MPATSDAGLELPSYPPLPMIGDALLVEGLEAWQVLRERLRAELVVALTDPFLELDHQERCQAADTLIAFDRRTHQDMTFVAGYVAGRMQAIYATGVLPMHVPDVEPGEAAEHVRGRVLGLRNAAERLEVAGGRQAAAELRRHAECIEAKAVAS